MTDAHPFWVVTDDPDLERAAQEYGDGFYHENVEPGINGFWVEAKDLREGDVLLGANGELLTFVSKERVELEEPITVYNFTVAGNHNYFVIAEDDEYGQTCVLVHNADSWGEWWQGWKDWAGNMLGYSPTPKAPAVGVVGTVVSGLEAAPGMGRIIIIKNADFDVMTAPEDEWNEIWNRRTERINKALGN